MSKLDELIKEKCPNGVLYKSIDSVVDLYYGKGNNIPKDGGDYPVYGCFGIVGSTSTYNNQNTPIVGHIGSAGKVTWGKGKHYVTYNGTICKTKDSKVLNSRFLYHILQNLHLEKYVKGSQPFLSSSDFGPIEIPVPPIEVQEEIVRILDKFGELEAELVAELVARQSQYSFWRGELFKSKNIKRLEDICLNVASGGTPNTSHAEYYAGNIPWLRTQEVNWNIIEDTEIKITTTAIKNSSAKIIPQNCVIIAMYGATVGRVAINNIPLSTNQACCNLEINPEMANHKYVFYWLSSQYKYIKSLGQGSQTNINAKTVKSLEIPIPPIEEQERIVSILDKFDKLVNDTQEGLPAEIEARRKQYEYYRNKLLNFKELNTNE